MASTIVEEKRSRKYYHSNEKYRKKKIAKEVAKHKNNKPKQRSIDKIVIMD